MNEIVSVVFLNESMLCEISAEMYKTVFSGYLSFISTWARWVFLLLQKINKLNEFLLVCWQPYERCYWNLLLENYQNCNSHSSGDSIFKLRIPGITKGF
jgi:hypothetical protein